MIPTVKFSDGKEFFYEHRNSDPKRSQTMATHHYHRLFEVYYFEKGDCNYFIDGRTYTLVPGDIVIIPENVIHRTIYTSGYERKLLNFSDEFIPKSVRKELSSILYLYRNPNTSKEVKKIFDSIDRAYRFTDVYSEDTLVTLVHSLFLLIAKSSNRILQKGGNSSVIADSIQLISEQYMNNISLNELASHFSMSPEHLSRTFKKETGFGFSEYLTLVRLRRAEQMLTDGNKKSVSEIAYLCGFNDSNYFSDRFKRSHGMSPLKYRKDFSKDK